MLLLTRSLLLALSNDLEPASWGARGCQQKREWRGERVVVMVGETKERRRNSNVRK